MPVIAGQWFVKVTGIDVVAVPYKAGTQLIQDTVAGQTQAAVTSIPLMETAYRSGKLRILGVTTARRMESLPEIPTVSENVPGFCVGGLGILVAPVGAPLDAMQKTNREIGALMNEKEYKDRILAFGFSMSDAGTPQSIAEFVRAERPYTHTNRYWQLYFDTDKAITETFGGAGYPVPASAVRMRNTA